MTTCKELETWRSESGCVRCVHYTGCRFFIALALMAKENSTFRDIMLPSFTQRCPMFFSVFNHGRQNDK